MGMTGSAWTSGQTGAAWPAVDSAGAPGSGSPCSLRRPGAAAGDGTRRARTCPKASREERPRGSPETLPAKPVSGDRRARPRSRGRHRRSRPGWQPAGDAPGSGVAPGADADRRSGPTGQPEAWGATMPEGPGQDEDLPSHPGPTRPQLECGCPGAGAQKNAGALLVLRYENQQGPSASTPSGPIPHSQPVRARVRFKDRTPSATVLFPNPPTRAAPGHMVRVTSAADSATMAMVWSMSSRLWAREKNSGWPGGR